MKLSTEARELARIDIYNGVFHAVTKLTGEQPTAGDLSFISEIAANFTNTLALYLMYREDPGDVPK